MTESIFIPSADGRFEPTEHAPGPWDPRALHGGAPAALIARAFERLEPGAHLPIARLGFEFLKPIPLAPLTLNTTIVRDGRRVQELAAELRAGEELVCRASALRIQAVPMELPSSGPSPAEALPGPEHGNAVEFALNRAAGTSLATTGMEMSWLTDPWSQGPGRVWMRLRHPLVPDEPATALVRLVATADFGNGVSAELPFDEYLFINADLTIHLWRAPRGEWIGLDAHTLLHGGGTGVAESVLHDAGGPVGRAFQTLVVQPR
ncbi:MAG TPA: thioesterase family protein [Solirubrobacteraceae bacterium]|nr:thioesterase family protein [Solirubrobacteraceae bacterium]